MPTKKSQQQSTDKIARTYTVASGALENFENLVNKINVLARASGRKNVDRGEVVGFLFNKCPKITAEEYFNEPVNKK